MKVLVTEMPKSAKKCPFSTEQVLHDGYGCVVDVSIIPIMYYCKNTFDHCDFDDENGCSGLKVVSDE